MRLLLWLGGLVFYFIFSGHLLMIMALFLIGMAMLRSGVVSDASNPWPRRFVVLGLGVALPVSMVLSWFLANAESKDLKALLTIVHSQIGPLVSLGYLGAIILLIKHGRAANLTKTLAFAGRMPLTNYLTQTVIAMAVFQHWGLAQFGDWNHAQCFALVVGVYMCQLAISRLWMTRFRFGPLEWMWRTLAYMRLQPLRRVRLAAAA